MPSENAPSSSAGATATDLRMPEHVGEPQPDEPDVALLEGAQHELGLLVHAAHPGPAACYVRALRLAPTRPRRAAGVLGSTRAPAAPRPRPGRTRPSATSPATPTSSLDRPRRGASTRGARLVAFPEMVAHRLPGRGPRAAPVVRRGREPPALDALAARLVERRGSATLTVVVGYLDAHRRPAATGSDARAAAPQNAAAVLHGGAVVARYAKHHLPNYGVFDEFRYFVPGDATAGRARRRRRRRARDLRGPLAGRRPGRAGARRRRRPARGHQRLAVRAEQGRRRLDAVRRGAPPRPAAPLAYVNMVGGQDELVFDGDSLVVGRRRRAARPRAAVRATTLLVVDLDLADGRPDAPAASIAAIGVPLPGVRRRAAHDRAAARRRGRGVRRARHRACATTSRRTASASVVLGLSGGIDSALVAAIACDALGAEHVLRRLACRACTPPSTRMDDAADLAERTGAALPTSSRSRRWSTRSMAQLAPRRASPRRTCRPGCAARR